MSLEREPCAYCRKRVGHQRDHLIPANAAAAKYIARPVREDPRYQVPACSFCNQAKASLCRVPVGMEYLIAELEEITGRHYKTWDGEARTLYAGAA